MFSFIPIVLALFSLAFKSAQASSIVVRDDGPCTPDSAGMGLQINTLGGLSVTPTAAPVSAGVKGLKIFNVSVESFAQFETVAFDASNLRILLLTSDSSHSAFGFDAKKVGAQVVPFNVNDTTQHFAINCRSCPPPVNNGDTFGNNCTMEAVALNKCLTVPKNNSAPLAMPCWPDDSQIFNLVARVG